MKYLRKKSGFSLVEVIVATAILLIGILAVSSLLLRGLKGMHTAENRSDVLHDTQKDIEAVIQNEEADDETIVVREPYTLRFENLGIEVEGTLVTVKKIAAGLPEGEIVYVTFIPNEGLEE